MLVQKMSQFVSCHSIHFPLAEMLQQIIREHHDLALGRVSVGHLPFARGQYKHLAHLHSQSSRQRENVVAQFPGLQRLRIRFHHSQFQVHKPLDHHEGE